MMRQRVKRVGALVLTFILVLTSALILVPNRKAKASGTATMVKSGNISMEGANTSRNIAVGSDGTIHVVYKDLSDDGIYYIKSTDSGATFSQPTKVVGKGREAEVAVSSNGRVFVSYYFDMTSNFWIAYSDDGTSFTTVVLGSATGGNQIGLHMATDGDNVYAVNSGGTTFWYSSDKGETYSSHSGWDDKAFSDVLVDTSTHNVIVIKDQPALFIRYSTDYGATFSEEVPVPDSQNQVSVSYSTATCGNGKAYIAGANNVLYMIDYKTAAAVPTTIEGIMPSGKEEGLSDEEIQNLEKQMQSRSICADNAGHVIAGYAKDGKVYYQYSTNSGASFSNPVEVGTANGANAAINTKTGDVLFLFTDSEGLKLYNVVGGVTGGSTGGTTGGDTKPATPEVGGRDGAVDAATLKEEYAGKTETNDSAAKDAGLSVSQVIDVLAGTNTTEKKELIEKAVEKGHLTLNMKVADKTKVNAKVDIPATLLSALTAEEMVDGIAGLDNIVIDLEIKITEEKTVSKDVSDAVFKKTTVGEQLFYFDADMFLTKNGTTKEALTEFGSNKISITIDIPNSIKKADYIYRLIRTHINLTTKKLEVDTLEDTDKNPDTFTMSTNKLCTFAFAYKAANYKAPKTGEEPFPYGIILLMFVSAVGLVITKKAE